MRIGNGKVKRRVWVGTICVLAVTGAWWLSVRGKLDTNMIAAKPKVAFVKLAGSGTTAVDRELQERAEYFDPTPLFFPTEHNFGQNQSPESARREPGQVFESFGPKLNYSEKVMAAYGQEAVALPERLADVLAQGNEAPFAGYGRFDAPRTPLAERSAFMEINALQESKTIVAQALQQLNVPRADFVPMEFLVLVGSAGIIGDPVLLVGSGWEDVDGFFRDYLVKSFRLGERVNPGRYRVVIGP